MESNASKLNIKDWTHYIWKAWSPGSLSVLGQSASCQKSGCEFQQLFQVWQINTFTCQDKFFLFFSSWKVKADLPPSAWESSPGLTLLSLILITYCITALMCCLFDTFSWIRMQLHVFRLRAETEITSHTTSVLSSLYWLPLRGQDPLRDLFTCLEKLLSL